MEEIEEMLDENGKFNINDIQILLDELVYNFDINEEQEQDLKQSKEDMNLYAKMHNEYNRKLPELSKLKEETKNKIEKIDEKQQRLSGRISKVDIENRIIYQSTLDDLEKEYQELLNNRNEAKLGYNETKGKYERLIEINKEAISKNQFENYASKLKDICKYCMNKMNVLDENLNNASKQFENAISIEEKIEAATSLKEALDEKNKSYYDYERIINYISNSQECKETISENLINDLAKEIENELFEKKLEEPKEKVFNPEVEETKEEVFNPEVEETKEEVFNPEVEETKEEVFNSEVEETKEEVFNSEVEETKEEVFNPEVEETKEEVFNSEVEEPKEEVFNSEVEETKEEKLVNPMQDYWEMQYPKINDVKPYTKDLSSDPMTLEQLSNQESIFKDEKRVDINHEFMSYQNAKNLGFVNQEQSELNNQPELNEQVELNNQPELNEQVELNNQPELNEQVELNNQSELNEQVELNNQVEQKEEKVGFFKKIKDKINKDIKDSDEVMVDDDEIYEEEQQNVYNIVNIGYAPENLMNKISYKLAKFFFTKEEFADWCQERNIPQEMKIR